MKPTIKKQIITGILLAIAYLALVFIGIYSNPETMRVPQTHERGQR